MPKIFEDFGSVFLRLEKECETVLVPAELLFPLFQRMLKIVVPITKDHKSELSNKIKTMQVIILYCI